MITESFLKTTTVSFLQEHKLTFSTRFVASPSECVSGNRWL